MRVFCIATDPNDNVEYFLQGVPNKEKKNVNISHYKSLSQVYVF